MISLKLPGLQHIIKGQYIRFKIQKIGPTEEEIKPKTIQTLALHGWTKKKLQIRRDGIYLPSIWRSKTRDLLRMQP